MRKLPCPAARWPRFSSLLDSALDLPEADRAAWLDGLAEADADLKPTLADILAGGTRAGTGPVLGLPSALRLAPAEDTFAAGDAVGPYRLEARIGEGGMGEVWRASRGDDGPRREVALKLPHAELLGGPFRLRFARERDTLAGLSHPHIAQLYDAGTSATGHPYLALELVQGQPITEWCRTERATLERRIELIQQVLEGLSYAHRRLIVHRDIKPSNVLVGPEGEAKLLDFGIAKLLHPDIAEHVTLTQPLARLATPAYAAPEQLEGGAITVATDLFSAGVLLFELCTGHRPFKSVPVGQDAAAAPLASHRADPEAAGLPEVRVASRLRGDLDAVLAKAIALEPSARYDSADFFAADLRRWRLGQPVQARRIGWTVRTQKFVRRNALGVSLGGVLALALAAGTAGVAWQAHRAEAQAARANAIKTYLINLFAEGDPRSGRAITKMTAKELFDIGAERADAAFAGDKATEIELLHTIADIYNALDDSTRAEAAWSRRLELARALYGPLDPRVIDASMDLVDSEVFFQDEDKARKMLAGIREPLLSLYGRNSVQWAKWLYARGVSMRDVHGGRVEATADLLSAVAIFERLMPRGISYTRALEELSGYQYLNEQCEDAIATRQKEYRVLVAEHRFDTMEEICHREDLGQYLECTGDEKTADAQWAEAQRMAEHSLGRQSYWYISAVVDRGYIADMDGDRDRAIAFFQSLMTPGLNRDAATGSPSLVRKEYGGALARQGRAAEAIPLLEKALAELRVAAQDEYMVRETEYLLGDVYDQAGRAEEARKMLKAALDETFAYEGPSSVIVLQMEERWARFLLDHGDTPAATREFTAVLQRAKGAPSAGAAMAAAGLARIALAAGATAEADAQSARAVKLIDATTGMYDRRRRVDVQLVRARALAALGRVQDARALATQAVADAQRYDAPQSQQLARAQALLKQIPR